MKYIITFFLAILITITTPVYPIIFPIDPNICPGQDNPGDGGLLVTVGIPTLDKVPPSPKAPPGQNIRLAIVYLPRGYNESNERYPVVYYLPGFEGDHTFFVCGDKLILDELISNKLIVPIIVVSVDASLIDGITPDGLRNYSSAWYVNSELNGVNKMVGQFETFLVEDTVNFIDANFRTKADRAYRALAGQSMGGYGSLLLGMKHPDKFIGFASESGTTPWTNVTTNLARPPDGALFTLNSLIQPEIPTSGPDAGKIVPGSLTSFTYLFFSMSGALSPNIAAIQGHPANPWVGTYFVDLPFQVNGDGTPVYAPGPFIGANPVTGAPVVFEQSLVLDEAVVERWREKDPFFVSNDPNVVSTLKEQAFYLDGGNQELINARGARLLSAKLANQGIDHEYLLYNGKHVTCLVDPPCSRNRTVFQMLSAVFSENGRDPNTIRSKIVGTGTIIIEENAQMLIEKGTLLGIETLPHEIITTNITLQLNNNGKVLIGDATTPGGGLQIGNLFSKAKVFGDPSLNNNSIQTTLIIDGPGALFQIGEQGFFGLAVGLVGQFPTVPNDWGMSTLFNANNITIDIRRGIFEHNQIASGLSPAAAVFALGPCANYTFKVNFPDGTMHIGNMRGGANLATIPDGWRMQVINIDQAGILEPGGIRTTSPINFIDTSSSTDDFFYKEEMASTGFYFNKSFRNLLSSAEQLEDRGNPTPFEITTSSLTELSTFLGAQLYTKQGSKKGAIAVVNGATTIGYLDVIENIDTIIRTTDIPILPGQQLNFPKILDLGAIGIWVETFGSERELFTVYDVEPLATAAA